MENVITIKRRGRPRKNEKAGADTKASLIRAGIEFLTERGFSSVGLDEITKASDVPKGSFYHWFGSKAVFGEAVIDAYGAYFSHKLAKHFRNEELTPCQRLEDFILNARHSMAKHDFARGCLVGNLGQEIAILPGGFRQKLVDVFQDWERQTENLILEGIAFGEFKSDLDARMLANLFWVGWEGAVLRAKLERRAAPLDAFAAAFINYLKS